MAGKRKRVKHYHEPGDVHELTFSCYHCLPLLTNDQWRRYLARSIEQSTQANDFRLVPFVFMPEHVHLLVLPRSLAPDIGAFLTGVKRPCSVLVKQDLMAAESPLLDRLTVSEGPGRTAFRFWQERAGYDRNLQTQRAVLGAIDYIHNNPVRRGLCQAATDWHWSSARYYQSDPPRQDPSLPTIHGLPPEFFVKMDTD